MSEELTNKIEELERLLQQQSLQIQRLQEAPIVPAIPQAPVTPAANYFDITRIPDVIKIIPGYDGDIKGLPAWISSVEQKIECAKTLVPNAQKDNALQIWTSVIRDKISGKANEILMNNQTECNWEKIKSQLIDRFSDKRDLSSIINKIPYIKQGNKTVQEFYDECGEILADLNAKTILDPGLKPCATAIMASYEAMLTTAFVDGLHEPISSLTRTSRPNSLLAAYQHALDQFNAMERRKERFRSENKFNLEPQKISKPVSKWNQNNRQPPNQVRSYNQSFPHYSYNPNFRPQPQNNVNPQGNYNNYQNTRPVYPSGGQNFNPPRPFQNQPAGNRPPFAIKQETPSTSNFRRNINTHEEHLNYNNDDWSYEQDPNSGNAYHPDQEAQESYTEADDLNFQSVPDDNSET